MAYCAVTDIENLIQLDLHYTSKPTEAQALIIINQVSSEINLRLRQSAVALPITDADQLNVLTKFCSYGAAAQVELAQGKNIRSKEAGSRVDYYLEEYRKFLANPLEYLAISQAESAGFGISSNVTAGTTPESSLDTIDYRF